LLTGATNPTDEELSTSNDAVAFFLERYPQYIRTSRNQLALFNELHREGLSITEYESIVKAYEACCARGELLISLKAIGLGDRAIDGHEVVDHPRLDRILQVVKVPGRSDHLSADAYRRYNDKLDCENGVVPPRSPRALADMDRMFEAFWQGNPGYEFENQSKTQVRDMIFEYLDDEAIAYSTSAVAGAAATLREQGKLFRDSDTFSDQTGEFVHSGTRLVVHKVNSNPVQNPPTQQYEIVDRVKKITLRDLSDMTAHEYAEALRNPSLAPQIEELLRS
jgi:hypothetical protein